MDCRYIQLKSVVDERGALHVAEEMTDLPFALKRVFYVTDLILGVERGHHAHRATHQAFFCVSGNIELRTRRPRSAETIWQLDSPGRGVYLPPMTWTVFSATSQRAICLVLASTLYASEDYIRDHGEFEKVPSAFGR